LVRTPMKQCRRVQGKRRMRFNRVAIRNRDSEILTANLKTKDATSLLFAISAFQLLTSGTPAALFRGLLPLGKRKALHLFPASCTFPNVISTLAVSHKTLTLTHLSRRSNA
jgi:hypothetical protein